MKDYVAKLSANETLYVSAETEEDARAKISNGSFDEEIGERLSRATPEIVEVYEEEAEENEVENDEQEKQESLDLRDLVADEVSYKGLDSSVTEKALRYIKNSDRLMSLLDMIVAEAIQTFET